jgi:hypothetical protein
MARKTTSAPLDLRLLAADALAGAIADLAPKVLYGSAKLPGFFQGASAKVKQLAEFCVKENWLEDTGTKSGPGKTSKTLYRLTETAKSAILKYNPVSRTLEGLVSVVGALKQDTDASLHLIQEQITRLSSAVASQERGILEVVGQLTPERVAHPSRAMPSDSAQPPASPPLPNAAEHRQQLTAAIVQKLQGKEFSQNVTLHDLFGDLRATWPALTVGQFHDSLRALTAEGRIRLAPFTRALTFIAHEAEPLYLGGEVLYYAYGR